ncbi:MAG: hypothetical protein OD811_03885 [Alphaproteobacteria bacterium]
MTNGDDSSDTGESSEDKAVKTKVDNYEGIIISTLAGTNALKREAFEDFKKHKRRTVIYLMCGIPIFFLVNLAIVSTTILKPECGPFGCVFDREEIKLIMVFSAGTFGLSLAAIIGLSSITRQHWSDGKSGDESSSISILREFIRHYTASGGTPD